MQALRKLGYGLYIVSSEKDGKFNGQIANTVFQTTSDPVTVAACINKKNLTHEYIKDSGMFSVSVLTQDAPMQFIGRFGFRCGRDMDNFKDTKHKVGVHGTPIVIEYTASYLECEVIDSIDLGTHMLFVGKLLDADTISEAEPMTYDHYHKVKGGKSPKTAPTYIEQQAQVKEVAKMSKYKCTVCGYVYDPEVGDPDSGIKPGTPFEQIPNDWVCPVCGVGKDQFEKVQ